MVARCFHHSLMTRIFWKFSFDYLTFHDCPNQKSITSVRKRLLYSVPIILKQTICRIWWNRKAMFWAIVPHIARECVLKIGIRHDTRNKVWGPKTEASKISHPTKASQPKWSIVKRNSNTHNVIFNLQSNIW